MNTTIKFLFVPLIAINLQLTYLLILYCEAHRVNKDSKVPKVKLDLVVLVVFKARKAKLARKVSVAYKDLKDSKASKDFKVRKVTLAKKV